MNKLINDYNRGFSLKNDDLRFIDDAVRLALSDIVKSIGGATNRIMWGCEVSEHVNYITIAEGAVFWNNEIWHVTQQNFYSPLPIAVPLFFVFIKSPDSTARLDKDMVTHYPYEIRQAIVRNVTDIPTAIGNIPFTAHLTNPGTDSTAPTVPTGLYYTVIGERPNITWLSASDSVGVAGYEIWYDQSGLPTRLHGTTSSFSYYMQDVYIGQDLVVYIKAFDAAGNKSAFSVPLVIQNP